jgi:RHS repeat-associated protein
LTNAPPKPEQLAPGHRVSTRPLDLTRAPTADELMAAGQLGGPLFPTHELKDSRRDEAARWAFGRAIDRWNRHEYATAVGMFRKYAEEYSDSPWAAEAELHIGCDASYNGRYTEADALFNKLIAGHQGKEHPGAKMLLNKARQRLALLKVEQNNLEEAGLQFQVLLEDSPDWRHRTYASHWIQRLSRYAAAKNALVNCGAEALAYALEKEGRHAPALQVRTNLPPTMSGHSLASLAGLAAGCGFELAALQVTPTDLPRLPLPAIIQITPQQSGDKGHYWVLDKMDGQKVELFDPQSQRRFRQTVEELAREWSGRLLVFAKSRSLPGRRLALSEMEAASGGCCGVPAREDNQGDPCRNGAGGSAGGCTGCSGGAPAGTANMVSLGGAPAWTVNMVNLNLYVVDTPMWYEPPIGPAVSITLSYNSQSAIAQNEPFGNKWQFNYASYLAVDTAGTVTLFMPDGRQDTFAPDGAGGYTKPYQVYNTLTRLAPNSFELRFPDDTVYAYQVPPGSASQQPMLVEIRDAWGQKLSFGYDASVRLTTITDAQGLMTTLTYNASDLVIMVTDPFGRNATFAYDGSGNLTTITDMGGYWSGFTYDTNVYLTSLSNASGTWIFRIEPADGINNGSNPYPPPGGVMYANYRITITDPLGQSWEYQYDGYSSYAWTVSPRDYVPWRNAYENNFSQAVPKTIYNFVQTGSGQQGELSQITYPEGDYVAYEYDLQTGNQTIMTDAHGHATVCAYNSMGNIISVTDPKGTLTTLGYATNGVDLSSIVTGLGQISATYDSHHQVVALRDYLGNLTSFSYNGFGQEISRVDALGITNQYVYDASNRLSQIVRGGQEVASYTYDPIGRILTRTDAAGLTLTNEFDALDQITRVTYPDGKSVSYVYSSCCPRLLDSRTDRAGRTTCFSYDALRRLIQVINPEGGLLQYAYDANGNRIRLVDPNGNITTFAYDRDNRLAQKTFADGKAVSFQYDEAGLLTNRTDARGVVATYAYDANHLPTATQYSDGTPGITNVYDSFGRLLSSQDGVGVHTYAYDAASRVITNDGPWANGTVTYAYDALGRATNVLVEGSSPIGYTRDALGRLTGVNIGPGSFLYAYGNASHLVRQLTRPNGSFTTYQYDSLNRLTGVSNQRSTGEILSQFLYTYDARDLRAGLAFSNSLSFAFNTNQVALNRYNQLNQLTNSSPPGQALAYDDAGNLTRGFTPESQVFSATYDAENRLRSIAYTNLSGEARLVDYSYDHHGLLAEISDCRNSILSNTTRLVRGHFLVLQERNSSNTVVRAYTWGRSLGGGIGGLLGLTQAGQDYSYVFDGSGNIDALLDGAQSKAAAYAYEPFGALLAQAGGLDQPMRFATMPYDEGTGLSLFPYRAYSAALGRWLTRDLLGEPRGANLYAFAGNNPVSRIDPLGLAFAAPGDIEPGGVATIVCDGAGGARVKWLDPDAQYLLWCVKDCIIEHEYAHMSDAAASNPGICIGMQAGTPIWFDDGYERPETEIQAHQIEADCLKKKQADKRCNKDALDDRLRRVNAALQGWENQQTINEEE